VKAGAWLFLAQLSIPELETAVCDGDHRKDCSDYLFGLFGQRLASLVGSILTVPERGSSKAQFDIEARGHFYIEARGRFDTRAI
jgi:hypothetical protein